MLIRCYKKKVIFLPFVNAINIYIRCSKWVFNQNVQTFFFTAQVAIKREKIAKIHFSLKKKLEEKHLIFQNLSSRIFKNIFQESLEFLIELLSINWF